MAKTIKNYGRSVKERLLNISRAEKYSSQLLISRYFQERLLYRLSVSDYKDKFILKGGALLYAASRLTHEYACSMASSRVELGESKTRTKQEQEWN